MPLIKIKKVWNYCTYNKPFFLLVLILYAVLNYISDSYGNTSDVLIWLIVSIISIVIMGYGMTITRDRINNGIRLPKILIKDVLVLGVMSFIVYIVYMEIQGYILNLICSPFNFPNFELEELLLDLPNTIHLLYTHNPMYTMIFVVAGGTLFYITSFFIEIAIARLADTGSILTAFNLREIKRNISSIGWGHYAKEYTLIVIAIVIFSSACHLDTSFDILNYLWFVLLNFLGFTTQFLGIGAIYSEIKEKEQIYQ